MPTGIYKHKLHSEETKEKIREARLRRKKDLGYLNSPETRIKIRKARIGKHHTEATRKKVGEAQKGEKNHNWGKHHTREHKQKISEAEKGKYVTETTRAKMSKACKGNKNHNWLDGKSFEPYTLEFNRELKDLICSRDGYKCQKCGCPEIENNRKLTCHHIDYNKKNCKPENLISLCSSCNSIVNFNREYYTEYFQRRAERGLNLECYNELQECNTRNTRNLEHG